MSTFSTLEIDPDKMREGNQDFIGSDKSDDSLISLYQETSKDDLKQDISNAKNLLISDSSDMATLDSIVDLYETNIKTALLYKQLFYFYFERNEGEGSKTYDRMVYYDKMYKSKQNEFKGYTLKTNSTFTATRVLRG